MSESTHPATIAPQAMASEPSGIGGWLLVFTVGLLPHVALAGSHVAAGLRGTPGAGGSGLALAALTLLGHGAALVLILTRRRIAPAFVTLYLPLTVLAAVLTPDLGLMQAAEASRLGMANASQATAITGSVAARTALGVAITVLWLGYWLRSRRVRATFGTTGIEALGRHARAT